MVSLPKLFMYMAVYMDLKQVVQIRLYWSPHFLNFILYLVVLSVVAYPFVPILFNRCIEYISKITISHSNFINDIWIILFLFSIHSLINVPVHPYFGILWVHQGKFLAVEMLSKRVYFRFY